MEQKGGEGEKLGTTARASDRVLPEEWRYDKT